MANSLTSNELIRVPATHSQKALYFLQILQPEWAAYNIPFEYDFPGQVDSVALELALATLCSRHDILRTHFTVHAGEVCQIVAANVVLDHKIIDARQWSQEQVHERCQKWAQTPFNLSQAPLFRSRLFESEHGFTWHLCFHHIAFDHLSIRQFSTELNAAYQRAQINPASLNTTPLSISLVDYAVWQQQMQNQAQMQSKIAYWQEQVPDPAIVLDLPTDFPRPAKMSGLGSEVWFTFSNKTSELIRDTAQKNQVSRYLLTMTQYAVLLHRYSKAERFLLGTPFANRSDQAELQLIFGCFVNTLPLPFDFTDNPNFTTLLARTRSHFMAVFERQDVPFDLITETLNPVRNSSYNPLFQVAFLFQDPPMSMTLGETLGENKRSHNGGSKFDLTFWLWDDEDDKIGGSVEFATSLYSKASILSLLDVYERIIQATCLSPSTAVSELALVDLSDPNAIALYGPKQSFDLPAGVHGLIAQQVKTRPNALAVISDDGQLTYAQLWQESELLAQALIQQGVTPGMFVGVGLERSTQLLVACLGIWQAGAAYVPLDPEYPADRLAYMMKHSKMKCVLTQENVQARIPSQELEQPPVVLLLDSMMGVAKVHGSEVTPFEVTPLSVDPQSLAYVIYTSGSTGEPKGVAVSHVNVANLVFSMIERPGFTPDDKMMAFVTLSFDMSVYELFVPLIAGGVVDIVPNAILKDPVQIYARCKAFKPTVMQLTPSMWRMLLQGGWHGHSKLKVLTGGEALPDDLRKMLLAESQSVWNMYGPTEATVYIVGTQVFNEKEPIIIGSPVHNTQCYVFDEKMQPLPVGLPGELYVGGDNLAQGYLNQPQLTSERFISHELVQGLLYKTGDRVARLANGTIKYINRLDNQVKLRGFRIELGEIEEVLLRQPEIAVGAIVVQGQGQHQRIAAFYVVKPGMTLNSATLRQTLVNTLPFYMVPAVFTELGFMPLSPAKKVDRKKLSALDASLNIKNTVDTSLATNAAASEKGQPPTTPLEKQIAALWCQALGLEAVNRQDHFFELGGHSLLLVQIAIELRSVLDKPVVIASLFDAGTLMAWAAAIEATTTSDSHAQPETAMTVDRSQFPFVQGQTDRFAAPASSTQKSLFFVQQMQPESGVYNIAMQFEFDSTLKPDLLAQALALLTARHETLRTSFEAWEQELKQIIHRSVKINHEQHDATSWSQEKFQQVVQDCAQAPFDLGHAPLLRSRLLQVKSGWSWCLCVHHIAFDELGTEALLAALATTYTQLEALDPPSSDMDGTSQMLELGMVDYVVWQKRHKSDAVLMQQLEYWQAAIPDSSIVLDLATDYMRPAKMTGAGSVIQSHLSASAATAVRQTAANQRVSRYVVALTQFAVLLHRYSGVEQFLIGSPFVNRPEHAQWQNVLGCFVNTLPLPFDFTDQPNFETLLGRTRAHFLKVFERQDTPFERIVEVLNPPRETSHHPLFQVAFMYQDGVGDLKLGEALGRQQDYHNGTSKFDLTLMLWDNPDQSIGVSLEFSTELFARSTMDTFLNIYEKIIVETCQQQTKPVNRLALLDHQDLNALALHGPRFTSGDVCLDATVGLHGLVAAMALAHPSAVAVIGEDATLTYEQLWLKAAHLAEQLRSKGVLPGQLIGISLERSSQLLVGLLGILQAGATYVPLDPDYPADRLAYMMTHSQMIFLLTEEAVLSTASFEKVMVSKELNHNLQVVLLAPTLAEKPADIEFTVPQKVDPEQPAYVIYTSGSTGLPKGVSVPHRSVVNFLQSMMLRPGFNLDDQLMAVTTLSFDISVLELFLPLVAGGVVHVVPSDIAKDPMQLQTRLVKAKPTVMQATPATWRMLIQAGWQGSPKLKILIGGEAFPDDLRADLLSRSGAVWNMYGPTETTIWSTCAQIKDAVSPVVIGAPIHNTQCYVLDEHAQPLPVGVPGELYIGGDGVALGYLYRQDLTQERFVTHELFPGILYRTGDLVTRLADGTIKYHNRLDNQVKIRGFRIELGEIEQVLLQQEAVESGAVVVQGTGFDKQLVAFYVVKANMSLTLMKLRRALTSQLPKHMTPGQLVPLDALPLTPSGKIDRKKLATLKIDQAGGLPAAQPPTTPSELYYAKLFCEILKREKVNLGDNFFDIGGHSFASLGVIAAAKRDHQISIPANAMVLNNLGQLAASYPLPGEMTAEELAGLQSSDSLQSLENEAVVSSEPQTPTTQASHKANTAEAKPWWQRIFKQ